jgi:hypothetical protein
MGRPEDLACPIAFLCSNTESYFCRAVFDLNGGIYGVKHPTRDDEGLEIPHSVLLGCG